MLRTETLTPATSNPLPPSAEYLSGGFAIALARATNQIAQLIIFVVGARVLGPEDFGLFALVSAFAVLAAFFAQAGWNGYILSWRGSSDVIREVLFAAALAGFAVGALGAVIAEVVAIWRVEAAIPQLILLFSIWILLATNAEAQNAVLIRDGKLVGAALSQIAGDLFGMGIALWLLYAGTGVLSLAFGRIAAQGVQLALALVMSKTFPSFKLTRSVARELAIFSMHVISTRMIVQLRMSLGTFIIGGFLGVTSVGYFRAAQRLIGAIHELITEPLRMVAWVFFRRAAEPHADANSPAAIAEFQRALEWMVPLILGIAAPVYVGVAVMSQEIIVLLLGESWRPAAEIVMILALASLFLAPSALSEPLLALVGKIRYLPRLSLMNALFALTVILPAAQLDVVAVAWAQTASGLVMFASTVWLHNRVLGLSWRKIAAKCVFLLPILVVLAILLMIAKGQAVRYDVSPLFALLLIGLPAVVFYLATVAVLRAQHLPGLFKRLRGT